MDREYWTKELLEAERKLDAARGRTALNVAARKLQRARAELKRLEAEPANRSKQQVTASRARRPSSS